MLAKNDLLKFILQHCCPLCPHPPPAAAPRRARCGSRGAARETQTARRTSGSRRGISGRLEAAGWLEVEVVNCAVKVNYCGVCGGPQGRSRPLPLLGGGRCNGGVVWLRTRQQADVAGRARDLGGADLPGPVARRFARDVGGVAWRAPRRAWVLSLAKLRRASRGVLADLPGRAPRGAGRSGLARLEG